MSKNKNKVFLAVVGGGPGGYPAAFQAADLGMDVVLIDRRPRPGGVCLYEGCIPSKSILHASRAIQLSKETEKIGISFAEPKIDLPKLREWKQSVVDRLTKGVSQLTKQRNIRYVQGQAEFVSESSIKVSKEDGEETINFEHAIVAPGSQPVQLPFLPDSDLIMDSANALNLESLPERMLVVGGGYIGLELGQAYASLGVKVSVTEALPSLLANVDQDLVNPLRKRLERQFEQILLKTKVTSAEENEGKLKVTLEGPAGEEEETFDKILVAVGRRPSTSEIGLDKAGVKVGDDGFIIIDEKRVTSNPAIQAIGDVAGQPMLAHKATHEGRTAAEALSDGKTVYEPLAVPAVIFTDPEIAWCGLTEDEARRAGRNVSVGKFPWQASGRAITLEKPEGLTKVIADAESGEVIGIGISGESSAEMIGEATLAIEMGAVAEDIALTIHPHPTLSETIMEAAQRCMTDSSTHFMQRQ
ncbi:MAG: dihydrolipoyl dehydrogenase [Lentisphaeria bacterium]